MNTYTKIWGLIFLLKSLSLLSYAPAQVQAFKQAVQNNKSGKPINCAQCDFRGVQELAGIDAHGSFLPGVLWQPCIQTATNKKTLMICNDNKPSDLTGINLSGATLFSSCFDGAILDKADLSKADVSNSSFIHARLKDAHISQMIIKNTTFCGATMPDGVICKDSWKGQGLTIDCLCSGKEK